MKKTWRFCLPLFVLIASVHATPAVEPFDAQIKYAKEKLAQDKGKEALAMLQPLLNQNPSYTILILTARSYAAVDKPREALKCYQLALVKASTAEEIRTAQFGIARMQFWLDQYVRAGETFQKILKEPALSPQDYELAMAGYVKSLAYYDRPRKGYHFIPPHFTYTTPQMVVAAAQASLWSDWADITKDIVTTYQPILAQLPSTSPLAKDMRDVQWQMDLATSPHVITPDFYYSADSEKFFIRKPSLSYQHYWNQTFQTILGIERIGYTQTGQNLIARDIYLTQIWRPTRTLIFKGRLKPSDYQNFHPFLWLADGNYRPNDYIGLKVSAFKEVVETFPAFANRITTNQYAVGLYLNPVPYVYFDLSDYQYNFSDSNKRLGYFASGRATIWSQLGLSAILRFRHFTNRFQSPNYFSPDSYTERMYLLRIGRKYHSEWHYYLDGGMGRQWLVPSPGEPSSSSLTHQWGFGLTGPLSKHFILSLFYTSAFQASAFRDSPGYHYQNAGASINILL
jgi:tetratricopeptide (TPR) repeat protein